LVQATCGCFVSTEIVHCAVRMSNEPSMNLIGIGVIGNEF